VCSSDLGRWIAEQTVVEMIRAGIQVKGARVAVLGLTFKENCEDLRNSRVIDLIHELESYGVDVLVCDPIANSDEAKDEYDIDLIEFEQLSELDAVVAAVAHDALVNMDVAKLGGKARQGARFIYVKSSYDRESLSTTGFRVWRL